MRGRVSRRDFWLYYVLPILLPTLIAGAIFESISGYRGSVLLLFIAWPAVVVTGKRWHDRDKSAWWMLVGLIPLIGQIWVVIENFLLLGTDGPNSFGDKPN